MRISSAQLFQTGLDSINSQQSDLLHIFQQIGSGQRMVTPGDDPLAAAQVINISQAQAMNQRFAQNRAVARSDLALEENTLNSVTLLLQDVKTRLLEAGNGTLSDADRQTLADVLAHARSTLLGLANTTDGNGRYLFSGSRAEVRPFDEDSGHYAGDDGQRPIQVDATRRLAGADTGMDVFGRAAPGVLRFVTRAGAGHGLPAADTNTGTGVIGSASVVDAGAVVPGYRYEIRFVDTDSYVIAIQDVQGQPIPYDPIVHDPYPDWSQPFDYQPGASNIVRLPFGVDVQISGQPAAGDTFGVAAAQQENMNVFHVLDAMIDALGQPLSANERAQAALQNTLASSLQRVDLVYDNVLTVRASVGARLNELEALDDNGAQRNLDYRGQLSALKDLDYYTATTQLELRRSALEAAALAFQRIQGLSLFSMK